MPNPDLIPEPFAQSGDKNPIPLERAISDPIYRASWKAGFPPDTRLPKDIGGEAPDGLDFNGVLNILSQAVVFLQKGNAYQFDAALAPYPIGALVRSNDNLTTYQSTVPNNSNNPNSNMTGWRVYNSSGFVVDNLTTNDSAKALSAAKGKALQDSKLEANKVGVANGVASLDANTKVPAAQLPNASTTAIGAVQLNNTLTSMSTTQALTAAQAKVLNDTLLSFVGSVSAFAMNAAPTGWLDCSGQAVSRTTYADLFAKIGTIYGAGNGSTTFTLPDLRGEFVRGFDNGRGIDTGRKLGSAQGDMIKSHSHTYFRDNIGGGSASSGGSGSGQNGQTGSTGGTETRPRNIALLYCIKY